jgi:hypothetical protein
LRPTIWSGVGFGDAGDDGARLGFSDIDFHVEELVGAFHGLGGEHLAYAEIDLGEVVDLDLSGRLDFSGSGFAAEELCLTLAFRVFPVRASLSMALFASMRGKTGRFVPDFCSGVSCPQSSFAS